MAGVRGRKNRPIQFRQRKFTLPFWSVRTPLRPSLWQVKVPTAYDAWATLFGQLAAWFFENTDLKYQCMQEMGITRWTIQRWLNQKHPVPALGFDDMLKFARAHGFTH